MRSVCRTCDEFRLFEKATPNPPSSLPITFFTCGLWVLVWIDLSIQAGRKPYHCTVCGEETHRAIKGD
jgi:hypothetical protein